MARHCGSQRSGKATERELDTEDAFWHELVASGIGGRTVAEAKMAMSYAEFLDWCRYRQQYGSLNIGMRVDRAVARHIAVHLNTKSQGRKFKADEFSPYDNRRSKVDINDPEAVFTVLKGLSNGKTGNTDG